MTSSNGGGLDRGVGQDDFSGHGVPRKINFRRVMDGRRVVLACDQLVYTRPYHQLLHNLVRFFPKAPLVTYVHRVGATDGEFENRRIYSTPLSRVVKSPRGVWRSMPLWSGLSSGPKKVLEAADLVVTVGEGACLNFAMVAPNTPILHFYWSPWGESWRRRGAIGRHMMSQSQLEAMSRQQQKIIFSSKQNMEYCRKRLGQAGELDYVHGGVDVLQLSRPARFERVEKGAPWLATTSGLSGAEIQQVQEHFRRAGVKLNWVCQELDANKKVMVDCRGRPLPEDLQKHQNFYRNPASERLQQLVKASRGTLILTPLAFNELAIRALAQGRPLMGLKEAIEVDGPLGRCGTFVDSLSDLDGELLTREMDFDPGHLSRSSVRFNAQRLKAQMAFKIAEFALKH
jgi:hypothetical protein